MIFLLASATQNLCFMLQQLWNQKVTHTARGNFCNKILASDNMRSRLQFLSQNSFDNVELPERVENRRCNRGLKVDVGHEALKKQSETFLRPFLILPLACSRMLWPPSALNLAFSWTRQGVSLQKTTSAQFPETPPSPKKVFSSSRIQQNVLPFEYWFDKLSWLILD